MWYVICPSQSYASHVLQNVTNIHHDIGNGYLLNVTHQTLFFVCLHPMPSLYCLLFYSGMKPLSCSAAACHWRGTGLTSAATTGVSPGPRLWITCTSCWGATTTSGPRWPAIRPCSCSRSSSRPTSSRTSKDATGPRTSRTAAICTGTALLFRWHARRHHRCHVPPLTDLLALSPGSPRCHPWNPFQRGHRWKTAATCQDSFAGMTTKNCPRGKTQHHRSLPSWWETHRRGFGCTLTPECVDGKMISLKFFYIIYHLENRRQMV